jgi:hypothetical protein
MVLVTVRLVVVLAVSLTMGSGIARAEKKYGPGASDTEIKIGQTMPYSGPASIYKHDRQGGGQLTFDSYGYRILLPVAPQQRARRCSNVH